MTKKKTDAVQEAHAEESRAWEDVGWSIAELAASVDRSMNAANEKMAALLTSNMSKGVFDIPACISRLEDSAHLYQIAGLTCTVMARLMKTKMSALKAERAWRDAKRAEARSNSRKSAHRKSPTPTASKKPSAA